MKNFDKSQTFFFWLLSFILGTFLGSFLCWEKYYFKIALGLLGLILIFFWKNKECRIFFLALIFLFFGWQRISSEISKIPESVLNNKFSGTAKVIAQPDKKIDYQKITVESEAVGKFIFFEDVFSQVDYGDELRISCQLELPENKLYPGDEKEFDYQKYLAKDKIYYVGKKCEWEKIGEEGNFFWKSIFGFKDKIEKIIESKIPFLEGELLKGLLLGKSGSFSEKLQEDFSRTGLTHIVAVSGYNITIIANYLMLLGVLVGLWRQQAFYLAILGIIIFIFLIGVPPSAVRAGIMGSLLLWAMKNGRLGNSQNALFLAGAIMLLKNPMLLRFDVGFQLSFLSTLGIIYIYPILENFLIKKNKALGIVQETVLLTLAAQIFVLPIILYNFGNLSLISLLANLLVLPIIPLAMLLGFLMIVFSWVPILNQILSWLSFLSLTYEIKAVSFLASFPWASVEIIFSVWGMIFWYAVLFAIIIKTKKHVT